MQIITVLLSALSGVFLYRLGRREGEAGRILPLLPHRRKTHPQDELLTKIEQYQGRK